MVVHELHYFFLQPLTQSACDASESIISLLFFNTWPLRDLTAGSPASISGVAAVVVGAGAARVEVVTVLTLVALLGLEHFEGPGTAEAKRFLPLLSFDSVACVDSAIAIAFVDTAMVGAVI